MYLIVKDIYLWKQSEKFCKYNEQFIWNFPHGTLIEQILVMFTLDIG